MKMILQRLLLGVLLTALGGTGAMAAEEELVVYSGRKDQFIKPVIEQFTAKTGIKVVLHSASSTALLNKLRIEGERTDADLFISNDAGNLQTGSKLGLFQPVSAEIAAVIPANLRAKDNTWLGLSARARVLVVNENASDIDFVESVFDLADPRLKDRLAITNSSNESFIAGVTVYMLSEGREKTRQWLQGMKTNADNTVFAKHSKIVKAVAEGRKDVGLVNHYYIYRHLAKHPDAPLRIIMPDQGETGMGVAWNVAGIAMTRHTPDRAAAEKLIRFLVSPQGQAEFAGANSEYPTREGVSAAPEVPAAGSYHITNVPMAALGEHRIETLDLLDSVGMP
ncbi:extracellular solute-binding protein [Sulfuriflexus sp.]|uniref:extracellular solute-binding protein n=1 Tax=Sulfuriflexus sp. TaxID=2015443 RepID=UPI0028CD00BD|nr:extracellular solute-binding protein [Sulfuriflexus sp.]MDT8403375.1 extracellular solute-binding protein [Sulfuriflexus sp.]